MASGFKVNGTNLTISSATGKVNLCGELNKPGTKLFTWNFPNSIVQQVVHGPIPVSLKTGCDKHANAPTVAICACDHLSGLPKRELIEHIINCTAKVRVPIPSVKILKQKQSQNPKQDCKIKIRSRL